ncbi:virulence factor [Candidatus Leptofilum sp.]|uniref:virulence factor n=1 Tax=Candidatus Leptofilum sp. TaxID=3241576 RepID=UPI003B590CC2
MAKYQIIYWRDIPAQVKVVAGRQRVGRPLSKRFPVAIDEAAMRSGKTESTDYLAEWRNSDWQERDGEIEEIADALVDELEADYPPQRLRTLIQQHGLEQT